MDLSLCYAMHCRNFEYGPAKEGLYFQRQNIHSRKPYHVPDHWLYVAVAHDDRYLFFK